MQLYAGECMYRHANGVVRRLRLLNVSPTARRQEVASSLAGFACSNVSASPRPRISPPRLCKRRSCHELRQGRFFILVALSRLLSQTCLPDTVSGTLPHLDSHSRREVSRSVTEVHPGLLFVRDGRCKSLFSILIAPLVPKRLHARAPGTSYCCACRPLCRRV